MAEGVAAHRGSAAVAVRAGPAISQGGQYDVVARGEVAHAGADAFDDAGPFVSEDDGRLEGDRAVHDAEVAVTDARMDDAYGDFAGARFADFESVANAKRVSVEDDSLHARSPSMLRSGGQRACGACLRTVLKEYAS